ncbi:hypothetical protein JOC75_000375 [Metabacillus crassostreae]|uniref:DUF3997 domain-containing protein n=1 Tax=Metabacillus crassostreae TaxID=929098 RepID=UPI001957F53A|nr:hypothetical protein [Metabacillus crassostreae]
MKKRTLYCFILFSLLLLILTGCPGISDYSVDLTDEFSVVRTSADQVFIAPKENEDMWGSYVIPPKVTEVAWDDHYILAKQFQLKNDPEDENDIQIVNKSESYYWILKCDTREVYGPYNKAMFIEKKQELGISEELVLRKIEEIR